MKLRIPRDFFDNPTPPRLFLCTTNGKRIGELPAYDTSLNASWNKYSELRFSIDRQYTDVITGETVVNPLFEKAEGLRKVEAENMAMFIIQDPDTIYADKDSKTLSCFSSEHETSVKYLENFRINTGEDDSVEVAYLEGIYGIGYSVSEDDRFELAPLDDPNAPLEESNFDSFESYYIKDYTDNDSYTYQQKEIMDASVYRNYNRSTVEWTLYKKKYSNVRFYWPTKQELSLLHLIFEKIPGWSIGHVDASLWRKERKFDKDRISVYDFLMNEVSNTFKCVVAWDTLAQTVNFYEEAEDGITEDNTIQREFDTDIYITRENLANEINISYSSDDIKTKLRVSGSDDLSIRDVNLGRNYLINLDFYHDDEWMEEDLKEAYSDYLKAVETNSPLYSKAVSGRAAAYNHWNDIMNAVPADGNVVLIGDPFKKLYCIYTPIDTAYYNEAIDNPNNETSLNELYSIDDYTDENKINKSNLNNNDAFIVQGYQFEYQDGSFVYVGNVLERRQKELIKQLNMYHVNDDVNGNKADNILLRLKDKESNTVTLRIYALPRQIVYGELPNANINYYKQNGDFYVPIKNITDTLFYQYSREGDLYTNSENYVIRYETSNQSTGFTTKGDIDLSYWIRGEIVADAPNYIHELDLTDYMVSYIGAMGAYFVLTKDERDPANIEDYGVMMLREKQETYTALFKTQTEEMYSQEKYQCTISDEMPTDSIPEGARWLNSKSNPLELHIYENGKWVPTTATTNDIHNYENYQRYADNYNKLLAVQQVLKRKEDEAEYYSDGYAVPDMYVDVNEFNEDGYNPEGKTLTEVLNQAAINHFPKYIYELVADYKGSTTYYVAENGAMSIASPQPTATDFGLGKYYIRKEPVISQLAIDTDMPLFTFSSSEYVNEYTQVSTYQGEEVTYYVEIDGVITQLAESLKEEDFVPDKYYILSKDYTFVVYLKNNIPYVAFASSVGAYQAKMDYYSKLTNFEKFFTPDQWSRLSPLIREDEFIDSNFLLTGYESEEERMEICRELMENASKELKTLSQPSLEFSMNMANILALPEFDSLTSQFELGNFIRIELRPDSIKRSRLLGVSLEFDDLNSLSCQFGNLVTTQDQIDLHAELMQQAVQAGKQVAASASNWQRAVDKSNSLEEEIANGLQNAALEVGRASGQAISWDQYGFKCRKLVDGTTDQYLDEQIAIINNKIVFTNDGWKTSKAALGEFEVDINEDGVNEKMYGLLADAVVSGYISGSTIKGGNLLIGDGEKNYFKVDENGDVSIYQAGKEKYASQSAVQAIDDAYRYQVILLYDKSTIFGQPGQECTLTCKVYDLDKDITSNLPAGTEFTWLRNGTVYKTTIEPTLTVTNSDIDGNSIFSCSVTFDETKIG